MGNPRRRPAHALRAPRVRAVALALTAVASFTLLLVAWHASATPAASAPALRAVPAEHTSSMARTSSVKVAGHTPSAPQDGCQVHVSVTQTNRNGSLQQSSSVTSSSNGGSCSTCVVSVQSSQTSSNGANSNVNSTTQSCTAIGSGIQISNGGQNVHISSDGSSVTITNGGESISISSGGASISIQNGQVSITGR